MMNRIKQWLMQWLLPQPAKTRSLPASSEAATDKEIEDLKAQVRYLSHNYARAIQHVKEMQSRLSLQETAGAQTGGSNMEKPKESVMEVLGAAAPAGPIKSEEMTEKRHKEILEASKNLQEVFSQARDIFFSDLKYKDLKFSEQTYVIFDACTALIADRGCSIANVENTTMGIPDALHHSVALLQHNFAEKQKSMFDYLGRWVH